MSRPKAPKCPGCGRALYRTHKVGEKRDTRLYVYCRYAECEYYGDIRDFGFDPINNEEYWERKEQDNGDKKIKTPPIICEGCGKHICECVRNELKSARDAIKGIWDNESDKLGPAMTVVIILKELGDVDLAEIIAKRYGIEEFL